MISILLTELVHNDQKYAFLNVLLYRIIIRTIISVYLVNLMQNCQEVLRPSILKPMVKVRETGADSILP